MKFQKIFSTISAILLLITPLPSFGQQVSFYETNPEFNPNNIVTDSAVEDYNSLTAEEIRDFANAQGGTLDTYIDPENKMPAYYIIWQTAQEFRINPKFILTMLQKEQSLVTDSEPTQNQYSWAVGYSCYGGVCLDKYKGFTRQIIGMANKIMNSYFADLNSKGKHRGNFFCTFTKWCIGYPKETQDQQLIIPENKATAALYTYNPYRGGTILNGGKIGANYNFWKIWNRWFAQSAVLRPTGTLLKTALNDKVYLIQNNLKRPFASFSAFITRFSPEEIKIVDPSELEQYQEGSAIKFPQYSLLQNSQGDIFLLVDDNLKKIESMEVFRTLGFNPEEVEIVSDADLVGLKMGAPITITSSYPTGALIQDASTGGVYWVESGLKYPVLAKEIIIANWPGKKIISGHNQELEKYPKMEAIKFKDGTLVKADEGEVVYLIAGGKKLPIADERSFLSRGYKWEKVISTKATALEIHPTGQSLEYLDISLVKKKTPLAPLETLTEETPLLDHEAPATTTAVINP